MTREKAMHLAKEDSVVRHTINVGGHTSSTVTPCSSLIKDAHSTAVHSTNEHLLYIINGTHVHIHTNTYMHQSHKENDSEEENKIHGS